MVVNRVKLVCYFCLILHNFHELFSVYESMIKLNYEHSNIALKIEYFRDYMCWFLRLNLIIPGQDNVWGYWWKPPLQTGFFFQLSGILGIIWPENPACILHVISVKEKLFLNKTYSVAFVVSALLTEHTRAKSSWYGSSWRGRRTVSGYYIVIMTFDFELAQKYCYTVILQRLLNPPLIFLLTEHSFVPDTQPRSGRNT